PPASGRQRLPRRLFAPTAASAHHARVTAPSRMFAPKQPQSAVSRPVRIKCDDPRRPIVAKHLAKELLRCLDVAMLAQAKVDRPAALVDSAVQVDPFATDFDVGFIHAPGATDWTRESH